MAINSDFLNKHVSWAFILYTLLLCKNFFQCGTLVILLSLQPQVHLIPMSKECNDQYEKKNKPNSITCYSLTGFHLNHGRIVFGPCSWTRYDMFGICTSIICNSMCLCNWKLFFFLWLKTQETEMKKVNRITAENKLSLKILYYKASVPYQ